MSTPFAIKGSHTKDLEGDADQEDNGQISSDE